MIELLISIALFSLIVGYGTVSYLDFRNKQIVRGQVDTLVADVRWTMARAKGQESGEGWGIYFENSGGSGNHFYEIWRGDSYAAGTVVRRVSLDGTISFASPASGLTEEIIFSKSTGLPMDDHDIVIYSSSVGSVGEVYVNTLGRVSGILSDGLVGFWKFDDESGTAPVDSSGSGNDGVFVSSPSWATSSSCIVGGCLSLDSGDTVEVSSFSGLSDEEVTVAGWVYMDTSSNGRLLEHDWSSDGWTLRSTSAGNLRFGVRQSGSTYNATESGAAETGVWQFWAGTYDGETVKFYLDGGEGASTNLSGGVLDEEEIVEMGDSLDGFIDEVRVYNRALSEGEIHAIYDATK